MQETNAIEGTTCFNEHKKRKIECEKKSCRLWMQYGKGYNCAIIAAENGEHTLQEIGDIFGVTRMRICQMEKQIMDSMSYQREIKKA